MEWTQGIRDNDGQVNHQGHRTATTQQTKKGWKSSVWRSEGLVGKKWWNMGKVLSEY